MANELPIRCSCGTLRGVVHDVTPARGNRCICYCDDCQSFPYALECADRVLDEHGGTDIFQISPAHVEFTDGVEHLACLRLKRGGLLRWYADCCRTPICNTPPSIGMPFVGLIHSGLDPESAGLSRDDVLGPVRAGVNARFAKGDRSKLDAHDRAPVSMLWRFGRILLGARLRGDGKRSPFFDAEGKPRVRPRVLSEDELRAVETKRDAA